MKLCNRKLLLLGVFVIGVAALAACSRSENVIGLNVDPDGAALGGFDAVAYFAAESAVKGDVRYEYVWNGAKWFFSSEENMKKFQADPSAYAPQFGGYCAFAVSEGYTARADPEAWKIVDGKLYLNYNKQVREKWQQNQAERIEKGTMNWKELGKK